MKELTNTQQIAKGARLGKIATFGGLGLLVTGLVVSLVFQESPLLWLSFVFLLLGVLVSSVGTMNMNRWVREPRAEQALVQGLKGFDDRYRLYNYTLPAPHVLLSPMGLFVLTAMGQDGVIRLEGDRFRRDFSAGRLLRFMADEGLGQPFAEADRQVRAMQGLLGQQGVGEDVELENALVFYNPRAQLLVDDPSRPVVDPKGLKRVIRKRKDHGLSSVQYRQLQELFDQSLN